jgi:uncharacterized membrane protein required for colicin V production
MKARIAPYPALPAMVILAAAPVMPTQSQSSAFGPFDLMAAVVVVAGILVGRKRGMSQELLPLIQWLGIVAAGSFFHQPVGGELARLTGMNMTYCQVVAYLGLALAIKLGFHLLKRSLGEKLVGSDVFGRGEYYLGVAAGGLRFFCMLIMFLAVMHAPQISEAERAAMAKKQQEYYGDISFPTFGTIQFGIFHRSFLGQAMAEKAPFLLITPTGGASQKQEGIGQRRQREVESIFSR